MKNKKIMFLGITLFITIIAVILLKYFLHTKSLEEKISDNCNSYKEYWELDYVTVEDIGGINIAMSANEMKVRPQEYVSRSPDACREIAAYLFSDEFEYRKLGYSLNFHFYYNHKDFHVENIQPEMGDISVGLSTYDAELKDVAEWYPETRKLSIYSGDFQLEDLAEFKNLSRLWIRWGITQEEKEQILSICPDVNLLDTKIKDK